MMAGRTQSETGASHLQYAGFMQAAEDADSGMETLTCTDSCVDPVPVIVAPLGH